MLKQTETQNYQRAKTIKEIIHYVYEDGSEIMDAYTATLRFNQFGVKKVNDKDIVWDTNIPAKVFPPVLSPNVAGYQADIMSIPKQRIALKPEDFANEQIEVIEKTVVYRAKTMKATLTVKDDVDNKNVDYQEVYGKTGTRIQFPYDIEDEVKHLQGLGYVVKSNDFKNQNFKADNNDYEIHLEHNYSKIKRLKIVTQIVFFKYADGKTAFKPNKQMINYYNYGKIDKVNHKSSWGKEWVPSKSKFDEVRIPKLEGYISNWGSNIIPAKEPNINKLKTEIKVDYIPTFLDNF